MKRPKHLSLNEFHDMTRDFLSGDVSEEQPAEPRGEQLYLAENQLVRDFITESDDIDAMSEPMLASPGNLIEDFARSYGSKGLTAMVNYCVSRPDDVSARRELKNVLAELEAALQEVQGR